MIYSPHPMEAYRTVGVQLDHISLIRQSVNAEAIWNLYWLSESSLDLIPGAPREWPSRFHPTTSGLSAVIEDVTSDVVLCSHLKLHPERFLSWFANEDTSIFDSHSVFGPEWETKVLARAQRAADRMHEEEEPKRVGNVVFADFRRKA